MILVGLVVELGLLGFIIYTPWGNSLLGSAPLAVGVWLFILPFAIAMLILEEGRKAVARRYRGGR